MNNRKASEYTVKNSNIGSVFIGFWLSIKQFFYCLANSLLAIILYIAFSFTITTDAVYGVEKTTNDSSGEHLSHYSYLMQLKDLPADILFSIYMATDKLQKKWPKAQYPFYTPLEYREKAGMDLVQQTVSHSPLTDDLSRLISYHDMNNHIDNKELVPLIEIPLYAWLLREYASFYYRGEEGTHLFTVTVGGMLLGLENRSARGDTIAELVLEFLKRPCVNVTSPEPDSNQFFFTRWTKKILQTLLPPPKELTFSERLTMLTPPYRDQHSKYLHFSELRKSGYEYKKNYTFTSYEMDKDGKISPVSSGDILRTDEETKEAVNNSYPGYPNLPDGIVADMHGKGEQYTGRTLSKIGVLSFLGLSLLSMINSVATSAVPPRCETEGNCNTQNYYSLFNSNFTAALNNDPAGHFKLEEDIMLGTQHNLPVLQNCSEPFSGTLETGNHAIYAGNSTSPLFNCINQTSISGNFGFCAAGQSLAEPVIANRLLNENTVNIWQKGACDLQRPALGDVAGDANQVAFSGTPEVMKVVQGTGIVAKKVFGDNNKITAKEGQLFNAPLVHDAGGGNNTYHQESMNITRNSRHEFPGNEMLVADWFTSDSTKVVQNNINATFINSAEFTQRTPNFQRRTVDTFSSDMTVSVHTPEETVRMTNISDISEQRSGIENHGRIEVLRGGEWKAVCEDSLDQKTAHAVCKSMGYRQAEDEAQRILLKESLSPAKLVTPPVHMGKECSGYERHLSQCRTKNIGSGSCRQNEEAFLACSNTNSFRGSNKGNRGYKYRLTDYRRNDSERFDTTDTGIGRFELLGPYYVSKPTTVCSVGFDNNSASAACNGLGYKGGHIAHVELAPLPTPQILQVLYRVARWNCRGSEPSLLECGLKNSKILRWGVDHNCTHDDDVVIACNKNNAPWNVRLTDRLATDEYRTDTSATGLGRLEVYDPEAEKFVAVSPLSINDSTIEVTCRELGFNNGGTFSYLSAKRIPELASYDTSSIRTIVCQGNEHNLETCMTGVKPKLQCRRNIVLFCNKEVPEKPQIIPRSCLDPDQRSDLTAFFSGQVDLPINCKFDRCPVKAWDADGVKASDDFYQLCREQQLHTTNQEDWKKMWDIRCINEPDDCGSCHLPNEQLLGLISDGGQPEEIFIVSRQAYSHNETSDSRGLVRVSKLFSNGTLQLLSPANEALARGTLPVNQLITQNHVLGLYHGEEKGADIQLFWSPLEGNNGTYNAQTYPVNGEPLLLTDDSVFVKEAGNTSIAQYQLNTTVDHSTTRFYIESLPHKHIVLPESATGIFTATLKDEWLYVAAANKNYTDQVHVMRYSTSAEAWDSWHEKYILSESTNYTIAIDDFDQVEFLPRGQISTYPTLFSIPDAGGCLSSSSKTTVVPDFTDTDTDISTDNGSQQNDAEFAMLTAIPVSFVGGAAVGCTCYYLVKKKYGSKFDKEKSNTLRSIRSAMHTGTFRSSFNSFTLDDPEDENRYYNLQMKMADDNKEKDNYMNLQSGPASDYLEPQKSDTGQGNETLKYYQPHEASNEGEYELPPANRNFKRPVGNEIKIITPKVMDEYDELSHNVPSEKKHGQTDQQLQVIEETDV